MKQIIYYQSEMFPDVRFPTVEDATTAEITEAITRQLTSGHPNRDLVSNLLAMLKNIKDGEFKFTYLMAPEYSALQYKLFELESKNEND